MIYPVYLPKSEFDFEYNLFKEPTKETDEFTQSTKAKYNPRILYYTVGFVRNGVSSNLF